VDNFAFSVPFFFFLYRCWVYVGRKKKGRLGAQMCHFYLENLFSRAVLSVVSLDLLGH